MMDQTPIANGAPKEAGQACLALLEAEIDTAFGFLRLAEHEIGQGATSHATELIEKAILSHKGVLKELAGVPADCDERKRAVEEIAWKLFQAIGKVERQFGIL